MGRGATSSPRRSGLASAPVLLLDEPTDMRVEFGPDLQPQDVRPARSCYTREAGHR